MPETLEQRLRDAMPAGADYCSVRYVCEVDEVVAVRQDVPQPAGRSRDEGAMVTVVAGAGLGYCATSDLTVAGLKRAARRALDWAKRTAGRGVIDFSKIAWPRPDGQYAGPEEVPWDSVPLGDKFDLLMARSRELKRHDRIVDWSVSLWHTAVETLLVTSDSARAHQRFRFLVPGMNVTANDGAMTQTRSLGGHAMCQQGGMEILDRIGFHTEAARVADQAVQLLEADNCPTGTMDLVLAPDQMVLQIHESIGHPLELDRILGDERNYAGTSFVTPEMLGSYRYGSDLLNVTYDPSRPEQMASFAYDDEGLAAERTFIIRNGILERALGGTVSQQRAGLGGVANARASSWNRPPVDRMANLNLEPGDSSLEEMIAAVERGVYMETNCSWSIDDSRNKFQFGCEFGRLIEDGTLTDIVRNGNYRGISATFWRNLKMAGRPDDVVVMGTPNCGKAEPNQGMRVAHASPPCLFADVDVFGGV